MVEILTTFIIISAIIFFGFFAEFLFDRFKVPDVLLLIIFGFILVPYALKLILPNSLEKIAHSKGLLKKIILTRNMIKI